MTFGEAIALITADQFTEFFGNSLSPRHRNPGTLCAPAAVAGAEDSNIQTSACHRAC